MRNRLLSLLLVLCMLLAAVPAIALPAAAEGEAAEGVTVKFVNANVYPDEVVSEQVLTGEMMDFEIPALPDTGLGWYHMANDGTIREASTYLGEAAKSMTFYLSSSKSTLSSKVSHITNATTAYSNWPLWTADTSLDAYRGGWSFGGYEANGYHVMSTVNGGGEGLLQYSSIWSKGGVYLNSGKMVAQSAGALALSYTAPVGGEIDIDFETLGIYNNTDFAVYSDMVMAIAVNGYIVWPTNTGASVDISNVFTADEQISFWYKNQSSNPSKITYYKGISSDNWAYMVLPNQKAATYQNDPSASFEESTLGLQGATPYDGVKYSSIATGSMLQAYEAYCQAKGYPHGIRVNAGDRVDIVFAKANTPHLIAHPTVTYTEITSQAVEETNIYVDPTYTRLVSGGENWFKVENATYAYPTASNHNATDVRYMLTEAFGDGWNFVTYDNGVATPGAFSGVYDSMGGSWPQGICWSYGSMGRYYIDNNQSTCTWTPGKYGYGFTYEVDRTGLVDLSATFSITNKGAQNIRFSVLKNGTVVYPAGGEQDYLLKEHSKTHSDKITGLSVTEGDTLLILLCPDEWPTFTWNNWPGGGNVHGIDFSLTYTDNGSQPQKVPYSTTFAPLNGFSTPLNTSIAENGEQITFQNGWDMVGHKNTEYTTGTPINTVISHPYTQFKVNDTPVEGVYTEGVERFFGYESYGKNLLGTTGNYIDWSQTASPLMYVHVKYNSGVWNSSFSVVPKQEIPAGWRYTAEHTGVINVDITKLTTQFQNGASVAVFVNGCMVWPYVENDVGTYYADATRWATLSSTADRYTNQANIFKKDVATVTTGHADTPNGSLSDISVTAGDEVEVLIRLAGGFWSSNSSTGANAEITINYTSLSTVASIMPDTQSSLPDYPGDDYANKVAPAGKNGWSFVAYPVNNISAGTAITDFHLTTSPNPIWTTHDDANTFWSDQNVFFIYAKTGSETNWGAMGTMATAKNHAVGHRYTAPQAGYANIKITDLLFFHHASSSNVEGLVSVAIYVDGQKIWPAGDSWYTTSAANFNTNVAAGAMASAGKALSNVYLSQGSTVDLLMRNNADAVGVTSNILFCSRGTTFSAEVTYNTVYPIRAEVNAALELGTDFAFDMSIDSSKDYTVKVNGQTVLTEAGTKQISFAGIAAKRTGDAVPYEIWDGDRLLRKGTVSVNTLLDLYKQSDNATVAALAEATTIYGAAAAKHFNGAALTKPESTAIAALAAPEEANASISDTVDELVTFKGANLLLNDTIVMKITFQAVEGATLTAPRLQVAGTLVKGMFDVTLVGDTYEAVVEIPMAAYSEALQISVWDNTTQISETLTYGVGIYAYRVYSGTSEASLQNVLKAIVALGKAAADYQA